MSLTRRSFFARLGVILATVPFVGAVKTAEVVDDPAAERADQERRAAERAGRPFPNGAPRPLLEPERWQAGGG